MAGAWIISEKKFGKVGSTRWLLTWWKERTDPEDAETAEEMFDVAKSYAAAIKKAAKVLSAGGMDFDAVRIQKQRLEWVSYSDAASDWEDVGTAEEVWRS